MSRTVIKTPATTAERVSRAGLRNEMLKTIGHLDAVTVHAGSGIGAAVAQMQSNAGEPVLVTDDGGRLVGVLTERDILMKVLGRDIPDDRPVDEFMRREPETLTLDATIGEALAMMDRGRFRTIPLVDRAGELEGVLRQQDILEYVAEAFPQEILNLPPRPHQVAEEPEGA